MLSIDRPVMPPPPPTSRPRDLIEHAADYGEYCMRLDAQNEAARAWAEDALKRSAKGGPR